MLRVNPLKNIINLENKNGEFVELGIFGAIFAEFIYNIISGVFTGIYYIPIKNLTLLSVVLTLSTIVCLFIILNLYLPEYYQVYPKSENSVGKITEKINIKNLILLILAIIGFELSFESILIPILLKNFQISDSMMEFSNRLKDMPLFFYSSCVILYPIMEEIVARGVVLNGLLRKYSKKKAIVISAFVFGLAHLNIIQFFNAFMLGLFLGWIYVKTESIILCMVAHCMHNLCACIMGSITMPYDILFIKVSLVIIGAVIMFLSLRKLMLNMENYCSKNKKISI